MKRVDPTSDEYFEMEDKAGGPVNPLHGLKPMVESFLSTKYQNWTEYPLYHLLKPLADIENLPMTEQSPDLLETPSNQQFDGQNGPSNEGFTAPT